MLLHFKKEIIEAARRADKAIINMVANETWAELKILVPYVQYRHYSGLTDLRERIDAENEGVVIPPFSMRWMCAKNIIEQHFQEGRLLQNAASVVFKVCSKAVGKKLLTEMWVAGVKFRALPFLQTERTCSVAGAAIEDTASSAATRVGHRFARFARNNTGPWTTSAKSSPAAQGEKYAPIQY